MCVYIHPAYKYVYTPSILTGGQGACFLPVVCPATEGTAFLSAVVLHSLSHH